QAGLLKEPESRKRPHFEIGQGYIATSRLDGSEGSTKRFIAGLLTVDLHALVVAQQMWRAVYTHLQPLRVQQGSDESTGGTLAVGTSDGNDAPRRTPETEPDGHLPRTLQPHVDGSRVQLFEVGEPVAQAPAGHALAVTSAGSTGEGSCCSCASRRARRGRSSARGMIRSIAPWSSRNSLRWKPSGSFSRTVCSITRGPAKPMSALGSATITSPSIAKLADTPPSTGSVRTEINGKPSSRMRASTAEVLAICIREISASCIRAPPEAEKQTSGQRCSSATLAARTKRSPTMAPIDPPMKANSKAQATTGAFRRVPRMAISASFSPVCFCA